MSEPLVEMGPRMSDAEGLMWRLEKDPYLSSTAANLTVLDSPPDMERLAQRMLRATRIVPRLRQRVQPALGLQPPAWVDDADFDLTYHLRRLALAPPGDERDLFDLATLLTADPFDRTRPLWQMVIIEGLSGGRAALADAVPPHADGRRRRRAPLAAVPRLRTGCSREAGPAPHRRRATSAARERR